ncbi:MAG: sortase [Candidatus Saccharibacteria bacterium]|nr:sortase [Candidatus Saccharibacteria bacterium]
MVSNRLRAIVAIIFLVGGIYVAYLSLLAPQHEIHSSSASQAQYVREHAPKVSSEDTLIIPKISVNALINPGGIATLDNGAIWHRQPQNGNPVDGGNFVLAGHRYQFAITPDHTIKSSVLYDLDKMKLGDKILVDWHKKRYTYKVTKIYSVKPNAVEIEQRSNEPKMTLYTCTLAGSTDGRIVIEAKL